METRANPVPFILAGVVLFMAVAVGFKGCTGADTSPSPTAMKAVPEAPPADADTPADTIRTLRAGVAEMTNKFDAMSAENKRLLEHNQQLGRKVAELGNQVNGRAASDRQAGSTLQSLTLRLDELASSLRSLRERPAVPSLQGAGLTGDPEAIVWVDPVGAPKVITATPTTSLNADAPGAEQLALESLVRARAVDLGHLHFSQRYPPDSTRH